MSQSPVLRLVTKPPLLQAGLAGGLRCWWVSGPEPGMGPGGRFEVEDGIREGVLDSCCQRRQLRVAGNSCLWGKCGLCLQRGVRLWDPQFPCVLALPWCKKPCWRRPPPFVLQMLVEPLLSASCGSRCGRRSRVDMVPALMRAKLRERQKRKSSLSETRSDRGACREEWDRPRDGQGGCLQGPVPGPSRGCRDGGRRSEQGPAGHGDYSGFYSQNHREATERVKQAGPELTCL